MPASNYHPIDSENRDPGDSASATRQRREPSSHSATISLGIGVDYGTSNSAAAIFDGTDIHLVQLESDTVIMPSAMYVDRHYKIKTGQAAINQYIADNVGRTVELSAEVMGEVRTSTGQLGEDGLPEEASTQKVYGQSFVDGGQQGRLFRGIKRLLGNNEPRRLMVFDRPFRLVALITPLLARIKTSIESRLPGSSPRTDSSGHVCIGHPVNFEASDADGNSRALSLLSEAYGYAKFERQSFYPEPIAAALSYLFSHPNSARQTILAVDFGGGTLDLCILNCIGMEFDVVATHGISLGGDQIDQLLFRELLFPLLGKGEMWRRAGEDREIETLFPFEEYEEFLLNWAVSYMLNQNKFTTPLMQRIEIGDAASQKFRRLYDLIKNNFSYLLFHSLKDLKAELSSQQLAKIDIPELDIELSVTRAQFEQLIGGILEKFQDAITHLLAQANLTADDIQLVIRTGGSSLIPAVKRILENQFPDKVVEHDPFTSVAAGLAIAEFQGLGELQVGQRRQ